MATVFRPSFGRVLSIGIWAASVAGVVVAAISGPGDALRALPWLLLTSLLVWALFWRPRVSVDDAGVRLVNVLRTVDLPWPAIERIDTKWALTLFTAYGRFTAWAAPAPGGLSTARQLTRRERTIVPDSTVGPGGTIRPGDLPDTASGAAAMVVRRRWEQLRDRGYLDNPRLERDHPTVAWHWDALVATVVLLAAGVLSLVL